MADNRLKMGHLLPLVPTRYRDLELARVVGLREVKSVEVEVDRAEEGE